MKNNDYTINYKKGIISIGASFAERAGKVNSKEYKALRQLQKDYPDFEVKYAPKVNAAKRTYKGLTVDWMRQYIENHDDRNDIMPLFIKVEQENTRLDGKKMPSYYPKLKKFFFEMFDELTAEEIRMEIEEEKNTIRYLNELEAKASKVKMLDSKTIGNDIKTTKDGEDATKNVKKVS